MINRVVWANNGWERVVAHYDRALKYMPYAQAGVVEDGNQIALISYTTTVIVLWTDEQGNRMLDCTGTYSATTRKHIGAFLKEFCPWIHYQDAKRAYEGEYSLNVDTGAKVPIPNTAG